MWNGIKSFLAGERPSREVAKGRLQLVLAHDRTGLDGAKLADMRQEIIEVIARYVEVDPEAVDIQIERLDRHCSQLTVSSPLRPRSAHG